MTRTSVPPHTLVKQGDRGIRRAVSIAAMHTKSPVYNAICTHFPLLLLRAARRLSLHDSAPALRQAYAHISSRALLLASEPPYVSICRYCSSASYRPCFLVQSLRSGVLYCIHGLMLSPRYFSL